MVNHVLFIQYQAWMTRFAVVCAMCKAICWCFGGKIWVGASCLWLSYILRVSVNNDLSLQAKLLLTIWTATIATANITFNYSSVM
jgi:hypothetical protein